MSRRANNSVRMGPISLFTLVVVLCIAVMSVLCFSLAHSSLTVAQRQADFATDSYTNESAGQEFVAAVNEVLAGLRAQAGSGAAGAGGAARLDGAAGSGGAAGAASGKAVVIGKKSAIAALKARGADLAPGATLSFGSDSVTADFLLPSSRRLYVELTIDDDATYRVIQWKQTTRQDKVDNNQLLVVGE